MRIYSTQPKNAAPIPTQRQQSKNDRRTAPAWRSSSRSPAAASRPSPLDPRARRSQQPTGRCNRKSLKQDRGLPQARTRSWRPKRTGTYICTLPLPGRSVARRNQIDPRGASARKGGRLSRCALRWRGWHMNTPSFLFWALTGIGT